MATEEKDVAPLRARSRKQTPTSGCTGFGCAAKRASAVDSDDADAAAAADQALEEAQAAEAGYYGC